jgi:hypothetical protein
MIAGAGYVLWQKRAGILAMLLLVGALVSMADALRGGFLGGGGLIEILPGNRYAISGPMPANTTVIKDFIIDGQPADGSVRLVPEAVFSGYWFGGSMWRGAIVIDPSAREGNFELKVKESSGGKQNPTLVFKVKVWPDLATFNANASSFLIRMTGRSPFFIALGLALGGMAAAGANFLLGRLWARHLAAHRCGEIYKLRRTEQGTEVVPELRCGTTAHLGMLGTIYRPSGEFLCTARVSSCENDEVFMLVDDSQVRLGDVACLQPGTSESDKGQAAVQQTDAALTSPEDPLLS